MQSKRGIPVLDISILIPSVCGFLLVLYATRHGVGASPDSAHYIAAARSLAAGNGLMVPFGLPTPEPLSWWPPFYSILLAGIEKLCGADPFSSSRWLNAGLFAGIIAIIGWITEWAGASSPLSFCAASLLALANPMITIYSMAWSDGLFLLLGVSGLTLCAAGIVASKSWHFHAAGIVLGLCWFTRFAGLAFIIAAAFMTGFSSLIRSRQNASSIKSPWHHLIAIIFWPIPFMVWFRWRNASLGVPDLGQEFRWWNVADQLIAPETSNAIPNGMVTIAVIAIMAAAVVLWLTCRSIRRMWAVPTGQYPGPILTTLFGLAWWAYAILLLASSFLLGRGYPYDGRILSPLYVLALPILFAALEEKGSLVRDFHIKVKFGSKFLIILLGIATRHAFKFADAHVGMGTNDWRHSQTLAALREVPNDRTIYSNSADAIYLFDERNARWLPYQLPVELARGSVKWRDAEMLNRQFEQDAAAGAIVAFFFHPSHGLQTMTLEEFLARSGMHVTRKLSDGVIAISR